MFRNDRLRELRLKIDKTQKDMAKIFNMSHASWNRFELGDRVPDAETIISLARYFDVSTDYLLGLTESKQFSQNKKTNNPFSKNILESENYCDISEIEIYLNNRKMNYNDQKFFTDDFEINEAIIISIYISAWYELSLNVDYDKVIKNVHEQTEGTESISKVAIKEFINKEIHNAFYNKKINNLFKFEVNSKTGVIIIKMEDYPIHFPDNSRNFTNRISEIIGDDYSKYKESFYDFANILGKINSEK